jgi:hypothetical protein
MATRALRDTSYFAIHGWDQTVGGPESNVNANAYGLAEIGLGRSTTHSRSPLAEYKRQ